MENEQPTTAIIQFNGKLINTVLVNGIWYIAIKPICEAIGIEYTRQFKNINEHYLLCELLAKQPTTGADGKVYKMMCLPESHIYGWLFTVNTTNPQVREFQKKCYEVLYHHFHSKLLARTAELIKLKEQRRKLDQLDRKLLIENEEYRQLRAVELNLKQARKNLKSQDHALTNKEPINFP